jgi:hypothetical protein
MPKKRKFPFGGFAAALFQAVLVVVCFTVPVHAGDVQLAWDPSESDVAGYKVYYGSSSQNYSNAVDAGNASNYILTGLADGELYYFATTAYDSSGNESGYSNEIAYRIGAPAGSETSTPSSSDPSASSSGGGGGGCFIATAAYGSYLAPEVETLREFRDRLLMTNPAGKAFVRLYYNLSPPAAEWISRHETARTLTRWCLSPLVYTVKYPAALVIMIFCLGLIVTGRRYKIFR